MEQIDLTIFNLSPIAMWLQDFSGIKKIFDAWAAEGISDIQHYLIEDPQRLVPCLAAIKTINVNQSTLNLYEAHNLEEIIEKFPEMHTQDTEMMHIEFFSALWNKQKNCSIPVINYTCQGKRIDVQLRANILSDDKDCWDRVLLTTEDISQSQNARRFAESLFLHSPTALWVKDYSKIKTIFDQLKANHLTDLKSYIEKNPDFLFFCFKNIQTVGVNQALLDLFCAYNKQQFCLHLHRIFKDHLLQNFSQQLLYLWNGQHQIKRECEYQSVHGDLIHVQEHFVIFPDSQHNWDTVQIAFTDLTERKKLEDYLHYANQHDQLTQLYNRTFFSEEIQRLQSTAFHSLSCIYLDINGLKKINDIQGHHIGDLLIQRFAELLKTSTLKTNYSVSRIGGDEFVILMPEANQRDIDNLITIIQQKLLADQLAFPHHPIRVAFGYASINQQGDIADLLKKADQMMYKDKQYFYLNQVSRQHDFKY